jgi:hypothetical protein
MSTIHISSHRRPALAALASTLVAGAASAQWEVPPPYTLPTPPSQVRDGTVAAIADNSNQVNVYGPAVTFGRASGASYAGIGTTVMGTTLTPGTTTTTPIIGNARPYFGSSAWIRAGAASSATTVSMMWRTAAESELYGSSIGTTDNPGPMPDSGPWNTLGSDVLKIGGIAATGAMDAQGRLPTDAYTLEMTFDPGIITASYQNFSTDGWTIQNIVAAGELQISYFNPQTGVWEKNINVIAPGVSRVTGYNGSWDAFAVQYGANDANLASFVGSFGVVIDSANPTNSRVWAVLDHTSLYSVVPAPGALALLAAAGVVAGRRRRAGD